LLVSALGTPRLANSVDPGLGDLVILLTRAATDSHCPDLLAIANDAHRPKGGEEAAVARRGQRADEGGRRTSEFSYLCPRAVEADATMRFAEGNVSREKARPIHASGPDDVATEIDDDDAYGNSDGSRLGTAGAENAVSELKG
jgi:hypothetical protein